LISNLGFLQTCICPKERIRAIHGRCWRKKNAKAHTVTMMDNLNRYRELDLMK